METLHMKASENHFSVNRKLSIYHPSLRLIKQVFVGRKSSRRTPGRIAQQATYLHVLPPHLALQFTSTGLELTGTSLQSVGAVVQLAELLVTLQHFVHVDTHNIHHFVYLSLRLLQALTSTTEKASFTLELRNTHQSTVTDHGNLKGTP